MVPRVRDPEEGFVADQLGLHAAILGVPHFDGVVHRGRANFAALIEPSDPGNTFLVADESHQRRSRQRLSAAEAVQLGLLVLRVVVVVIVVVVVAGAVDAGRLCRNLGTPDF